MAMTSTSAHVGPRERGFSLIELMIAMVCTALVGGAIVAVLVAGQNAFRREPALADRTQNIRLAMSLIQKDIAMGGNEMSRWAQVFTPGLDAVGPNGSDFLQVLGSDGLCPAINTAAMPAGSEVQALADPLPACYAPPRFVYVQGTITSADHDIVASGPHYAFGFGCASATPGNVDFPPGQPFAFAGLPASLQRIVPAQLARYEIVPGAAPQFVPELWRGSAGNVDPSGPCGGGATDWQLVARGIYDMQVTYFVTDPGTGNLVEATGGAPTIVPPGVGPGPYGDIVRQVTVTLIARALEPNIPGYDPTTGLGPPQTLTSTTAPRTAQVAFMAMAAGDPRKWQ